MEDNFNISYPTSKRGFHLAHLNVQSINNKFDLLKIQIRQMGFQFFSMSETWLTEDTPNSFLNIDGYNLIRWDRKWHEDGKNIVKRGGGLAVYIDEDLSFSQAGLQQYNISSKSVESLWIRVIRENAKDMLIGTIYRPPGGNVEVFCNYLKDTLEEIGNNFNREIFLMGDFNINYLNPQDHSTKLLLDFEQLNGLKQLILLPTRGVNCIDLLFSNSNDITNAGVLPLNISDHDLIFATKKKTCIKRKQVKFTGRSYRYYDKDIFQTQIINMNWEGYWGLRNPNDCWQFILNTIESELSIMCPLKARKVRCSNEPWLTNGILEAIYDKDQAWKQAKRSGNLDDINRAKQLRNQVKDSIRKAKRDFIQDELENDLGSSKRFWEKINHILPTRDIGNTIRLVNHENGVPVEDSETPEYVNTFFTDIGPNLAKTFKDTWVNDLPQYEGEIIGDIHVDDQKMVKLVSDINVNKASSVTNVSTKVLKDAFMVLIPHLTFMYNLSFETGIFPDSWKLANVIPLKKGGDPTEVGNLRPISLLPLPGKLAERLMHTHIS